MSVVQGWLSLLTGCACCPSSRHVVTIHHGDGSVKNHVVNGPVVEEKNIIKWPFFPLAVSPYAKLSFNDLRVEANQTLKHFISNNIPFPKLPLSCRPIQLYYDTVTTIRLQDILPWGQVQPLRSNMGEKVRLLTRHKLKAYMIAIIEIARSIIGRCENGVM